MHENLPARSLSNDSSLLIVDRDRVLLRRVSQSLQTRGFDVTSVEFAYEGLLSVRTSPPAFAIIEFHPGRPSGLDVVTELAMRRPEARAVVITAYDSIATAVRAIKLGAIDYLPKPVEADDLCAVLLGTAIEIPLDLSKCMSTRRIKWEHINRVYELCDFNVSETARRLAIHRRSLQRILSKRAPR
ncbi:MAG: response regulator [Proteobacteria bacterium]|nr:response regulator [Pseudomonadota bacterium]